MSVKTTGYLLATAALGMVVSSASAWATPPASVVGTWDATANRSSLTLAITSQSGAGPCPAIVGSIDGSPIQGFYCPNTGRFSFVRKISASNNATTQVYIGNVGAAGSPDIMGGTFVQIVAPGGEFNFSAVRQ